jgi:hypothetical protein
MYELVYASAARRLFNPLELAELLKKARAKNHKLGISGILLYHEGSFLQVLEGEENAVKSLYRTIQADERHWRVLALREGPVGARSFDTWSMGFVSLDPALLREAGRHALSSNGSLTEDSSEALRLLDRFRGGEWRRYVMG